MPPVASRLRGHARRAVDQGLGRSPWSVGGADADRIAGTVATVPAARHAGLWGGVGLAPAVGATSADPGRLRADVAPGAAVRAVAPRPPALARRPRARRTTGDSLGAARPPGPVSPSLEHLAG
jgi:enediyne biosynthesis protein E3